MIGMVLATDLEAAPFLAWPTWQVLAQHPFTTYRGELTTNHTPVILIISGIGKVAAAVATHLLICRYGVTQIYNPGVCGGLKNSSEFEVGAIFRISSAKEGDRQEGPRPVQAEICDTGPFDALPYARLVTCDQPVFNHQRKRALSALGELVDMEGAAVVRVANMYKISCCLVKGVTDNADDGDREVLQKNVGVVSRKLSALFESL